MMEPQRLLFDAALDALGDAGRDLRVRGWDVNLWTDHDPETDTFTVSLRYVLPAMPRPIECARPDSANSHSETRP